jgi:hypothetical protein
MRIRGTTHSFESSSASSRPPLGEPLDPLREGVRRPISNEKLGDLSSARAHGRDVPTAPRG